MAANSYFTSPSGSDWYPNGSPPVLYTISTDAVNGRVQVSPNQPLGGYPDGTTVKVHASADDGYTFANWSGDASGTQNPTNVVMNGNKTITANFIQDAPLSIATTVHFLQGKSV